MKKIFYLFTIALLICSCQGNKKYPYDEMIETIPTEDMLKRCEDLNGFAGCELGVMTPDSFANKFNKIPLGETKAPFEEMVYDDIHEFSQADPKLDFDVKVKKLKFVFYKNLLMQISFDSNNFLGRAQLKYGFSDVCVTHVREDYEIRKYIYYNNRNRLICTEGSFEYVNIDLFEKYKKYVEERNIINENNAKKIIENDRKNINDNI